MCINYSWRLSCVPVSNGWLRTNLRTSVGVCSQLFHLARVTGGNKNCEHTGPPSGISHPSYWLAPLLCWHRGSGRNDLQDTSHVENGASNRFLHRTYPQNISTHATYKDVFFCSTFIPDWSGGSNICKVGKTSVVGSSYWMLNVLAWAQMRSFFKSINWSSWRMNAV